MAPFRKYHLVKNILASPFHIVIFDESTNRILQNGQMEVQVRYWDVSISMASTHYFDSPLRLNAQNRLDFLVQSINSLPLENFIQLPMDGLTANGAVFNNKTERETNFLQLKI